MSAQPAVAPDVELTLLAEPRWRSPRGEGRLARLDAALLGLLALGGEQPRDRVVSWLWPEAPLRNSRLNLRQRLFKLRREIGHPLVDTGAVLRLAIGVAADVTIDPVADAGELLGGFDFGDLDAFDAWLGEQRNALERRRLDVLAGQAARLEAAGALAEAIVLCENILARRPPLEHVWRRLMRLHYLRGDRAAAVATFEQLEAKVCREFGLRPSVETLALLDAVERLPAAPAARRGPLPAVLMRPPKLIGREAALEQIAQAWSAGRAVLLSGHGGIGKSRLLDDFLRSRPGVLALRARPGDAGMPYATIASLLAQANELFVPELAAPWREEIARLVPAFGAPAQQPARQDRLWQAIEATLAGCLDKGLKAIALDDLHQADEATLEALQWLLASPRLATLRWALATRTTEGLQAGLDRWLGDSQRVEPVVLEPLTAGHVADLLASLALPAVAEPTSEFVAALYRHAGGNPFFTLETLKSVMLQGADLRGPLPRPAAAEALIAHRLDRLTPTARDVLRLAALAGADLRLDLAARILDRPLLDLAHAWTELHAAQLAQDDGLVHDLVRACVLARLPPAAQRALHLALAAALETQPGIAPIRRAEHWAGGEAWREACRALREAAQQARLAGRLGEYEALLLRAAEAAEKAGDEAARFDASCLALSARMLRLGAEAVLGPLQRELERAGSDAQRSRLQSIRCEALLNLGRAAEAAEAGAAALLGVAAGSSEHFEAVLLQGRALAMVGRIDEAIAALESARGAAQRLTDPARLMQAHAALAHALFSANRHADALAAQEQALRIAEELGDATEIAHNQSNLATIALNLGNLPLTYRAASEAQRRFEAMGMTDGHYYVNAILLSRLAVHMGRLDEANRVLAPLLSADPTRVGATIHALVQVVDLGLRLLLGDAGAVGARADALSRLDSAALLPLAQASVLLARLRHALSTGTDPSSLRAALRDLGDRHPSLRDNPMLYCEWARWDEPEAALLRLQRLAEDRRCAGAAAVARCLELAAVPIQAIRDPAQAGRAARRLAREIDKGLMTAVHLPEAWSTLARALAAGGAATEARRCLARGRGWLHAATLPGDPSPEARRAFLNSLPAHRALMGADTGGEEITAS